MVSLVYKDQDKPVVTSGFKEIIDIPEEKYIWIDLLNITDEERNILEKKFKVDLQLLNKKKVRHSFRFSETEDYLKINTRLLLKNREKLMTKPVSFVIKDDFLIATHNIEHLSYNDEFKDIEATAGFASLTGRMILLKILGKILEYDIDTIEMVTDRIARLNKEITDKDRILDENMIYNITQLQEQLLMVRRNILAKERIIISLAKSERFEKKNLQKQIHILEKDLHSILDYISFDFERLEYIQDTLMGLINLKQNVIMKIFTIVSVIFLPPTLIASIYGMNFKDMPELQFPYAYPIAISIMAILSLLALFYFKRKKWI